MRNTDAISTQVQQRMAYQALAQMLYRLSQTEAVFSTRTVAEPTVTDKPRCQYCGHVDTPQDPVKRYRVRLYDDKHEWRTECQWAIVCWARQDIQMFGSVTPAVEEALEQFRAELRKSQEKEAA